MLQIQNWLWSMCSDLLRINMPISKDYSRSLPSLIGVFLVKTFNLWLSRVIVHGC